MVGLRFKAARCDRRRGARCARAGARHLLHTLNNLDKETSDLTALLQNTAGAVDRALQPSTCQIWTREDRAWMCEPASAGGHGADLRPGVRPAVRVQNPDLRATFLQAGMCLVVPMIFQGQVLGWLGLGAPRRGQIYTPEVHCFLEVLAYQTALAIHSARLRAKLETRLGQLQQAYRQIIQAQETERQQLAQTLHDESLQHLADLAVRLGLLRRGSRVRPADLDDLQQRLACADRRLREIVRGVHPTVLSDLGLVEGVLAFLETVAARHPNRPVRLGVRVTGFNEHRLPDKNLELALFRFVQNGLTNALTHGRPARVSLEIRWGTEAAEVVVEDDGCGMSTSVEEAARAGHFGLLAMRERIEAYGGTLSIASAPGRGTRVSGRVPLAIPSPAPDHVESYSFVLA